MRDETEKHDESLRSLIEAVVNGNASPDQHQQLEELLLDNEQARDTYLNYINLHASLNRWFLASDALDESDTAVETWMLPGSRPPQSSQRKRGRHRWSVLAIICLVVIAGIWEWPRLRPYFAPDVGGPRIVEASGGLEVQSADGSAADAADGLELQPGETIITDSDDDTATLKYADGTTIVLLGSASVTVDVSSQGGKLLELKRGMLRADVAPQPVRSPLLIVTPHTRVRVLGTRFELAADETDGTRLDLESGRVELLRGDEQPVNVEPNSIAIVPVTAEPIRVSERPAVIESPVRRMVFRGLKSMSYTDDGSTLIAATRWQAVYWFDDDRMEVIPFSRHGRDGTSLRHQENSLLVYNDHKDRRLVFWDTQTRQPVGEFTDINSLKRQFKAVEDRPAEWNPYSNVAAMSPVGDWFVIQVAREFRVRNEHRGEFLDFARDYDGKFVSALESSPDGSQLAIAVRRDRLDLIDLETEQVTRTWPLDHRVPFAMKFSANGERLVVGLSGHVAVYDIVTGEVLATFEQPGLPFLKVAISPDGETVAAASLGERVWMWNVADHSERPQLNIAAPIHGLTFAPNGDHLAVLSPGNVTVWDIAGHNIESLRPESETK